MAALGPAEDGARRRRRAGRPAARRGRRRGGAARARRAGRARRRDAGRRSGVRARPREPAALAERCCARSASNGCASSPPRRSWRRSAGGRCSSTPATRSSTPRSPATGVSSPATGTKPSTAWRREPPSARPRMGEPSDLARAHPYIPNSAPAVRQEMLAAIGVERPTTCTRRSRSGCGSGGPLEIEPAVGSEVELRRRVEGMLDRNVSARDRSRSWAAAAGRTTSRPSSTRSSARGEFLTAYYGETYTDHGKLQAFFEYASMVGELVECDVVSQPTYDWGSAAASAILMAGRLTGRRARSCPRCSRPSGARSSRAPAARGWRRGRAVRPGHRGARPRRRSTPRSATTWPRLLRDTRLPRHARADAAAIAERAHAPARSPSWASTRSRSACSRRPPRYGADIVCGELQPLGIHMHYGGGTSASSPAPTTSASSPSTRRSWSARRRTVDGRVGLRRGALGPHVVRAARRGARLHRHDAVPVGDRRRRLPRAARARRDARAGHEDPAARPVRGGAPRRAPRRALARRSRRRSSRSSSSTSTARAGRSPRSTGALAAAGILGPLDLSRPSLSSAGALLCVTEVHTQADIDRLADALAAAIAGAGMPSATHLRAFHQAAGTSRSSRADEPGRARPPCPRPSPASLAAVGDGLVGDSAGAAPPTPPALPELSQPASCATSCASRRRRSARHRHRPRPGHLHDEVQPAR